MDVDSEPFAASAHVFQWHVSNPPVGCWYREDRDEVVVGARTGDPAYAGVLAFMGLLCGLFVIAVWEAVKVFDWLVVFFALPMCIALAVGFTLTVELAFGHVCLRIRGDHATLFSGVWRIGRTRRLDMSRCTGLSLPAISSGYRRVPTAGIVLEYSGGSSERIARLLVGSSREFIAYVIRQHIPVT